MKLSQLLIQRDVLRRQSYLANLAHAYAQLEKLARRIADARLRGQVCLQPADPATERYWPVLTALTGSQSVIEEHFTDEDIAELADLVSALKGGDATETTFRLEDLAAKFLAPLRHELEQHGVEVDQGLERPAEPNPGRPDRN